MARRRITGDRAWLMGGVAFQLVVGSPGNSDSFPLISFDDIETDEAKVMRERSEWVLTRIIFWYRLSVFLPGNSQVASASVFTRLGQVDDDVDINDAADLENGYNLNKWGRVYQDDWQQAWQPQHLTGNNPEANVGMRLLVDTNSESTTNAWGFPVPNQVRKWDLNVKTRIREASSIVCQIGTDGVFGAPAGLLVNCSTAYKVLLQRGK